MECEFTALEKTREETAELQRSTKKVKEDHSIGSPTAIAGGQGSESLSYKAKLVGEIPGVFAQAFGVFSEIDNEAHFDDEVEDLVEEEVAIKLSRETKQHIRERWAHSLIIKVHGRTVGFHFLHSRIMQLWKPTSRLDCIDLGAWEPYFKPNATACSKVVVWARLPILPIEFYDIGVLKEIGNSIGPVLQIDATTALGTRGRYARICVQVDLAKPLVGSSMRSLSIPHQGGNGGLGGNKAPRQSSTRPNHSKSNLSHTGAFNAKDMGNHLRSRPSVVPPTSTPSASPEGKRKSMGLDASSSANLPSPLKQDHFVSYTPLSSGVVLSQPHSNPSNSIHKTKNRSKGKGKGK
nr:hypothetical protein CFP56_49131 [Quercus suber]